MRKFISLLALTALFSCTHTFREFNKDFPGYTWKKAQGASFQPVIDDIKPAYKIIIGLRHIHGIQTKQIPISLRIKSPSGDIQMHSFKAQIMDSENNYISDCAGDICDIESIALENFKFSESGKYDIAVAHDQWTSIPGIMEVGLIIDRIDPDEK